MVATYSCDAGYFLDLSLGGSEMRTCVDGFWTNLEPSCISKITTCLHAYSIAAQRHCCMVGYIIICSDPIDMVLAVEILIWKDHWGLA